MVQPGSGFKGAHEPTLHPGTKQPIGPDDLAPISYGTDYARSLSRKAYRYS